MIVILFQHGQRIDTGQCIGIVLGDSIGFGCSFPSPVSVIPTTIIINRFGRIEKGRSGNRGKCKQPCRRRYFSKNGNGLSKDRTKTELDKLTACTAKQELATKYGVTEAEVTTEYCANKINEIASNIKIEDFVYSTVQYAIWKVNGGTASGGDKIGDVLKTHKLDGTGKVDATTVKDMNQLNTLYQYLIKVRPEHQGYLNFQFDNTLKLNKPDASKEIFKETDTHYIYVDNNENINVVQNSINEEKEATASGYFPIFSYNPANKEFKLDSKADFTKFEEFILGEDRYRSLNKINKNGDVLLNKTKEEK